jgi:outer membrane receptor protein involved in Fe transport
MKNNLKTVAAPLTAAVATALYPAQEVLAQDQDQEQESTRVLEEVIVTATFRQVSMQDLPQSIQAFTNEDIIRNAFTDFQDVAAAIPSLTLIADMPGRYSVKFRGVSTGTGEYYTDSTSAIYLDETPLTFNSQQLFPELVDIERVESLPGPQGTLFGASALAGTLRIITNRPNPSSGFTGEVFGEYFATDGGEGSWALNGHVNIPLVQDTLALRLVAYTRQDGGWIDNIYAETFVQPDPKFSSKGNNAHLIEDDWNDYTKTGGRAALLWNINDDWSTLLSFLTEEGENEGNWTEDPFLGESKNALFHDESRNDQWWNVSLLIEGDLGFADLVSSTTFLDREITYEWENMIYEQYKDSFWGVYYGFVLYNSEYTYGHIFNDQTQDRFSQELRLTSSGDSRFHWMVGGFYEKINDDWYFGAQNPDLMDTVMWYYAQYWAYYYNYYDYPVDYPIAPTTVGYSNTLDRTVTQLAFFGELSYEFTDAWSATVGARWFEFERDDFRQNQFPEGLPPWGTMDTDGWFGSVSTESDTAFKFSTTYFFNDDSMVYFLFSQGFRGGGRNSPRAASTGFVPFGFQPDYADNWEIGMKSMWLENRLQLNVNLFLLDWSDRQFSQGSIDGQWWLNGTVNAGNTETKGLELNVTWQATDALRFEGNLTKLDAEAVDYFVFPNGNIMSPGDPLPNAPELSYWLAIDYTLPWSPWDGVMWTRLDYAYGDGWWNSTGAAIDRNPLGWIPDWNNTNLQLGLNLPNGWSITAFVRNLTDEKSINWRQNNGYATEWFNYWLGTDSEQAHFMDSRVRPRHYGFNIRKQF